MERGGAGWTEMGLGLSNLQLTFFNNTGTMHVIFMYFEFLCNTDIPLNNLHIDMEIFALIMVQLSALGQ